MDHKNKIEALLYSAGRKMDIEEISKLCRANIEDVKKSLHQLKQDYAEKDSSLMITNEGSKWKIEVKEEHVPTVSKIVSETEMNKAILETLAVIAFKYPVKQSEIIRIRNNKAYDHLKELEEAGYITRQKYGRTRLIKLTQKFFEYFDLPREKLKEKFETFEGLASAIEQKEKEIEDIQKEKPDEEKQEQKEGHKPEIHADAPEKIESYDKAPKVTPVFDSGQAEITEDKQTVGNLEVYENEQNREVNQKPEGSEESQEEKPSEDTAQFPQESKEEEFEAEEKENFQEDELEEENKTDNIWEQEEKEPEESKGKEDFNIDKLKGEGFKIKTPEEKALEKIEKKIDQEAENLIHPKKEEKQEEE